MEGGTPPGANPRQPYTEEESSPSPVAKRERRANANNNWWSQAVTHPSTNQTQRCLTSLIVCTTWYGRWPESPAPKHVALPHPPKKNQPERGRSPYRNGTGHGPAPGTRDEAVHGSGAEPPAPRWELATEKTPVAGRGGRWRRSPASEPAVGAEKGKWPYATPQPRLNGASGGEGGGRR